MTWQLTAYCMELDFLWFGRGCGSGWYIISQLLYVILCNKCLIIKHIKKALFLFLVDYKWNSQNWSIPDFCDCTKLRFSSFLPMMENTIEAFMQNTCFTQSGRKVSCFAACEINIIVGSPTMNTSFWDDQQVILSETHRKCWSTQCKGKKKSFYLFASRQEEGLGHVSAFSYWHRARKLNSTESCIHLEHRFWWLHWRNSRHIYDQHISEVFIQVFITVVFLFCFFYLWC